LVLSQQDKKQQEAETMAMGSPRGDNFGPLLNVNGTQVSSVLDERTDEFVITVGPEYRQLTSMILKMSAALRKHVRDLGDPAVPVTIQLPGQQPQNLQLQQEHQYRLSWDFNPPFPLPGALVFRISRPTSIATMRHVGGIALPGAQARHSGEIRHDCSVLPEPESVPWKLASHTIQVSRVTGARVGDDVTVASLAGFQRACSIASTSHMESLSRAPSDVAFDHRSDPQRILSALNEFARNGMVWPQENFLMANARSLVSVIEQTKEILMREPRLVNVPAPCYVMGDLHGNFQDLKAFEQAFWKQGPAVSPANLLFLGDYVDRRPFGVEVILYLFAQKMSAPSKVTLLRGNHEAHDMNMTHGFLEEVQQKFGPLASLFYDAVQAAFNCLPIAAIVGEHIFACHGGIPNSRMVFDARDAIMRIPCPLRDVNDHELATDLLWSDPSEVDAAEYEPNEERRVSHKFSSAALEKFLALNNLQMIIRAHQYKVHLGFQVQKHAKLITVFSSSSYCNMENEASCVLVADGKVRMMRLAPEGH